ncbi:MAG TPA: ATP-binding protein [Candidatus Coprosoma intestinipullorum]|uniref:ATP-binding protein n=1 Tax=Candidatus Coprosoma intestinipullorum TaxID=2840752 RepID=A0A9D1CZM2_9FIRM|nr:ATP-binding protein [Candidatus Coprosoma intestinipullorum]
MVIRERYLKQIRPFYDQDLIKVLIGIRRSGKSVILNQIIDELREKGIDDKHIIYINFEDFDYDEYTDPKKLNDYVKGKIIDSKKYYLFFDEIQNVDKWEKVINSFRATQNTSIFITGSNSDLLSSDLATHIAGRYVSFRITPFTFKEACELLNISDRQGQENEFSDYIKWGGLPQRFMQTDDESRKIYLKDVYDSIVIKDIIKRFNIKDIDLLNRIVTYILTTPSQTFSPENLKRYFESESRNVSLETLYNYLDYIIRANLISKAERYDIRGKRILTGKYKYYLTDLGFTNILSEGKREQIGAYLENIVYNELLARGYNVNIGNAENAEVDFVATRFNEKIYIQVAYVLSDERVIDREFGVYKKIEDNFPKYVLTMDKFDLSRDGIIHKNVIDWLLEE